MGAGTEGMIKEVDYLDGFQYAGGVLQFFPTSEGYVSATASQSLTNPYIFNYVYNYTDHLGNIRLSYTKDPAASLNAPLEIMEENHYYPFGLKHAVYSGTIKQKYELVEEEEELARPGYVYETDYMYKYNGKEFQDELGLNWYDYGWRNYDPALGRWNVIDPMADIYFDDSPYSYALNNPVVFIDPDGMLVDVSNLLNSENGLSTLIRTMVDLSNQTGLSLSVNRDGDNSYLSYAKDEDGNATITQSEDGTQLGSATARKDVMSAIDHKDTVKMGLKPQNTGSAVPTGTNVLYLDHEAIDYHINNSGPDLASETMGYGMTFLHEFKHTKVGGGKVHSAAEKEEFGPAGAIEDHVNMIRSELDANPLNKILVGGKQYGQRQHYAGSLVKESKITYKNLPAFRVVSEIAFKVNVLNRNGNSVSRTQYVGNSRVILENK